ncbi:MAG TPA: hypothetical protein VHM70_10690 [Polyangiaceae bacterium]|jgi:hypothetical protein|nr:hypothetical protein [Polyangiaceae bacterium]
MIQFNSSGVEITASPARLLEAKAEFEKRRMLHLPGLLSPELAASIKAGLERDGFEEPPALDSSSPDAVYRGAYQGGKVGQDLQPGDTARVIKERTNDPRLLEFVAMMTGSPPLQRCIGRVFRLFPMADDLPWHTDAEGGRLADLIINLNAVPHAGGLFQMREAASQQIFNEVGETAFGDGLLIRISPTIEHHYKAITGTVPKVTFSGWFVPKSV